MRKDKQPEINFEKIILEKTNLEINPDFLMKEEGISVDMSIKVNSNIDKSKRLLKLSLDLSLFKEAENPPLHVSVLAAGYFSVNKDEDIKVLEQFSNIQAPALVFPFVREIIADLTMRAGYPPLLVPPTNIKALIGKHYKKPINKKSKTR